MFFGLKSTPLAVALTIATMSKKTGNEYVAMKWNPTPAAALDNSGQTVTVNWTGGKAPYHVTAKIGATTYVDSTGNSKSASLSLGGKPQGDLIWTVTDAKGNTLSATTAVTNYYAAFRTAGGYAAPGTTAPWSMTTQGIQTLTLSAGASVLHSAVSGYKVGTTTALSGAMSDANIVQAADPVVCTVTKVGASTWDFKAGVSGTTKLILESQDKRCRVELTINITAAA